jgi:hypothetical protein
MIINGLQIKTNLRLFTIFPYIKASNTKLILLEEYLQCCTFVRRKQRMRVWRHFKVSNLSTRGHSDYT